MAAKNDITGDSIQTRGVSESYRNNYDLIFGNKKSKKDNNDTAKNEIQGALNPEEHIDGEKTKT